MLSWPDTVQRNKYIVGVLVFIVLLCVYIITLAPGVMHWDMAEFQYIAGTNDLGHDVGFPLYRLVSDLVITFGNFDRAYLLNVLSAFSGGGVVLFVYLSAFSLFRNPLIAVTTSIVCGISHALWTVSVTAEVYAMNGLWFAILVYLLIKIDQSESFENSKRLYMLFSVVIGLSLMTYIHSILVIVPLLAFFLISDKERTYILHQRFLFYSAIALFASILVSSLVLGYKYSEGNVVSGSVAILTKTVTGAFNVVILDNFSGKVLGGDFKETLTFGIKAGALFFYSLPGLSFILGLVGIVYGYFKNRRLVAAFVASLLVNIGSIILPRVPETFQLFIPGIIIYSMFFGFGLMFVHEKFRNTKLDVLLSLAVVISTLFVYRYGYTILDHYGVQITENRDNKYQLYPPKNEYTYSLELSSTTSKNLPTDSVIYANWYFYYNLLYGRDYLAQRDDFSVVIDIAKNTEEIIKNVDTKRVFIDHVTPIGDEKFYFVPFGYVYEVVRDPFEIDDIENYDDSTTSVEFGALGYMNTLPDLTYRGHLLPIVHHWHIREGIDENARISVIFQETESGVQFFEECPGRNYSGKCKTWRKLGYDQVGHGLLKVGDVLIERYNVVVPYTIPTGTYNVVVSVNADSGSSSKHAGSVQVR